MSALYAGEGFGLRRSLATSLLLHAALFGPWLAWAAKAKPPVRNQPLVVELSAIVTGRQVVALPPPGASAAGAAASAARPAASAPAPPRKQPPTQGPAPREAPSKPPPARVMAMTDVGKVAVPRAAAAPAGAPAGASTSAPAASAVATGATGASASASDAARAPEQSQPRSEADRDCLRRYLATLQRELQRRLRYPAESRLAGEVGVAQVRFWIDAAGVIDPHSLVVARSSGFARLDEQALAAVRGSSPLEPPPKAMFVATGLYFEREQDER